MGGAIHVDSKAGASASPISQSNATLPHAVMIERIKRAKSPVEH